MHGRRPGTLLNKGAVIEHIADLFCPGILQRLKHILDLLRRCISLFDHIDHGIRAIRQNKLRRGCAVSRTVDQYDICLREELLQCLLYTLRCQ